MMHQRLCPQCDTAFRTEHTCKVYCGPRCRQKAQRRRAWKRAGAAHDPKQEKRTDALMIYHNATLKQVMWVAQAYLDEVDERPSLFTGQLPEGLQLPDGVELVPQTDGSWVLSKAEPDVMEMFRSGTLGAIPKIL